MATIDDLDLGGLISKFLGSPSARARQDTQQDPIVETQALLETVALTFLLKPELALEFLYQARNGLVEVCSAELGLLDFLQDAVLDLNNPEPDLSDVSHLVDAQTALVELDKLSRVSTDLQPYNRYEASIGKFLATLKKSVSRKGRRVNGQPVLERTGTEAKEDLLQGLFYLQQSRSEVVRRLTLFRSGLSGFLSVDLSRIVASATIAKTRASLKTVATRLGAGTLSPTVAALNILTGSAALKAIAGTGKPLDPVIKTGVFPPRRTIQYRANGAPASATTSPGPWTLPSPPHTLNLQTTAGSTNLEVPYVGRSGQVWVLSEPLSAPITVPVGGVRLYVNGSASTAAPLLAAGSWSLVDVATALTADSGGLFEVQVVGTRLLLIGPVGETSITVVDYSNIPLPDPLPAPPLDVVVPSAMSLLGFSAHPSSEAVGTLSADRLLALLSLVLGATVELSQNSLVFTAVDTSPLSSLTFSGSLVSALGLQRQVTSSPTHAELVENGAALDPATEGVAVGARVMVQADQLGRSLQGTITAIEGTKLFFSEPLPRGVLSVEVVAALAIWWKSLLQAISGIAVEPTTDDVQQAFTPLLGNASRAQVADAVAVLLKQKQATQALFTVLNAADLQPTQRPDRALAQSLLSALEDHGLDRSLLLLTQGDLGTFFSLSADVASRSTNLLKSIELLGQAILPQDASEGAQSDGTSAAGTSPVSLPSVVRF